MGLSDLLLARKPSKALSWIVAASISAAWIAVRLAAARTFVLPLTYAIPLLVCVWTRNKAMLWSMATLFAIFHTVNQFWVLPRAVLPEYADWATWLITQFNIVVAAVIVHAIIAMRDHLEETVDQVEAQSQELMRQNEEMAQQAEEISGQAEEMSQQVAELAQQSEELSRQNEELQAQSEEINALNVELTHRENLLNALLDSARLEGTERAAMQQICRVAMEMLGPGIDAVVVYETRGEVLEIRGAAGLDESAAGGGPQGAAHRFAQLVIDQNRTACLNDASLRPDLTLLRVPGRGPFQAVLCAPLQSAGRAFGAVAIYCRHTEEWTTQQFRVAEWLAARSAHILEILRLQDTLRRQADLLDLTPDAIMGRRLDGTITFWGRGAELLYGWSRTEAIGARTHSLLRTRFPQPLAQIDAQLERDGHWEGELIHSAKDGREVSVRSRWLARRDLHGAIVELLESNIDLTDRKRAEEALRRSEEQLRVATLAADIGVWSWVPGTSEVTVSANWRRLFGVHADQPVTFETWATALHPDDRDRAIRELNDASEHGHEFDTEYRVVRPDGTMRWMVDRGRASYDENGRPVGMAGINIDITARKRAEEALREADRRKNEFLATLSHELRNPLAPIRYALQLIEGDRPSPSQPKQVIERQLTHMVRLVDDLLDMTRVASNKIRLRARRVQLSAIVQQAVEAAMPDIEQAKHSLLVSLPPEPVWLDADVDRLAQVLTNLLTNAARYTPDGGRINLTAAGVHDEVVVSVADTGIGLSTDDLARVFEMFAQVGEPGHGGLGIGLALVKGLVELHHGSVEARSAGLGKGSEFRVRLPRAEAPASAAQVLPEAPCGAARRRILVVDDNADSADMMKTFLEMCGHEVHVAYDGVSALEAAKRLKPDIGLFDIGLPGMNGYELARELRRDPANGHIYLVAVTGWGQEDDRQRARECGFDAHLTKPAEPDELHRLIAQAGTRLGA